MTTSFTTFDLDAGAMVEGVLSPGPTGGPGDGTHDVDLSGYYSPGFAIVGVVGLLVVVAVAFTIAVRRRLRGHGRRPVPHAAGSPSDRVATPADGSA